MKMLAVQHISRCAGQVQSLRGLVSFKGNRMYFSSLRGTVLERDGTARRLDHFVPVRHLMKNKPQAGTSFKLDNAKEGIPSTYDVIYHNTITHYYQMCVPFYFFVYICLLVLMYKIVNEYFHDREAMRQRTRAAQARMKKSRYQLSDPIQFVYVGFPFLTVVLLGLLVVSKNVIVRIYYDVSSGRYLAKLQNFGVFNKTIKFTQKDIQYRPEISSMWKGNVKVQERKLMILEQYFKSVRDFNRFVSYDMDRVSDLERQDNSDDVYGTLKKGLQEYQNSEYRSFEEKYRERRKLRRVEK